MQLPSSVIVKILEMRNAILINKAKKSHSCKLNKVNLQLEYYSRSLDGVLNVSGYILCKIDGMPRLIEPYLEELENLIE